MRHGQAALSPSSDLATRGHCEHAVPTRPGAVGFCCGGGMVGELAVHSADLDAGVIYWRQPKAEDVPA